MPIRIAIFGATSAIAAELARRYAARGDGLYLVGRSPAKLKALVDALGPSVAGHATQDFDRTDEAEACVAAAVARLGGLDIAVIAHGLLGDQLESERRVDVAEQIAHTNYLSVQALLIPLANHFEQRGGGHLVVLSTVAADRGRPRNYTYAAAKAALNVYLQGMRSRLYPHGVQVHTIKLGPVDTPMTVDHVKDRTFAQVPEVARLIERAVDRGVAVAYVPGRWRVVMFIVRQLPESIFQRIKGLSGR
jgi:decaprenylphospho-beta-D-erythro-pentofuranosid-2-ulose 2-reductase